MHALVTLELMSSVAMTVVVDSRGYADPAGEWMLCGVRGGGKGGGDGAEGAGLWHAEVCAVGLGRE